MTGFDIIGDVHGCATQLEDLLTGLGYTRDATGAHRHRQRQAVFVGDLIDRGPEQLQVLEIVKLMVDGGSAQIVLGNHEFNAISYATEHPDGGGRFLREHSEKNQKQHEEFLRQLSAAERARYVEWFKTLPLWLDLGELRVVHACWHEPSMVVLRDAFGSDRFSSPDQLVRACSKGDPVHEAVEVLLKGPEISLADHGQPAYRDKDRSRRDSARVRWWNAGGSTLDELAEMGGATTEDGEPYPPIPPIEVSPSERSFVYDGTVPVFYGHYWRQGLPEHLLDWTSRTACVDFSAVRGGTLTAYRWSGETEIKLEHYVPHTADVVVQTPSA
ncbi:metallophosphoesterase [Mycolicibacterium palauense]|uniref:metallophosphoesterase n=1 Tax=Mycolicibacterium palauense TaxID=2034511 RepID=UPI000BFECBBA|nr:metallophosphoesterase [Mycolicibacterium palauense]